MSSVPWPRLEPDLGQLGPMDFKSLGMEVLCARLRAPRKYHILDLGAADGENIAYFSRVPCKLYIEDIYDGLKDCGGGEGVGGPLSTTDLERLLLHDRGARFDVMLGWDLFDYLTPDIIRMLMIHLRRYSQSGSMFYLLTSTRTDIPAEPAKLTVTGENVLKYRPRTPETKRNPNYTPLALEKMMTGFALLHSFKLKNGMQEYVFSAA